MTKTVLIVDDEPANIDLLKGLMPTDYKIKAALKGEIAIKLVEKAMPDLLFLDLVMPGLSGFETLEKIRDLPQGESLPVAIVSGNQSEEDINQGKTLNVIAHLSKPVKPEQIQQILNQYL